MYIINGLCNINLGFFLNNQIQYKNIMIPMFKDVLRNIILYIYFTH